MNIEFQPATEYANPIVVSVDTYDAGDDTPIFIGQKKFQGVGKFEYEWILEYMSKDEAKELMKAIGLAIQALENAEKEAEQN